MRKKIPEQERVINCNDPHFLVTSRPGRGKTCVALWFAERLLKDGSLEPSQKILFLTFSRNAVYQISTASGYLLGGEVRSRLHIATYHSFMWKILQNFGRFAGLPPQLEVIWETKAKAATFGCNCQEREIPLFLACEVRGITYDCFAPLCISILRSNRICKAIAELYPVIIVDEFQDTNEEQWELIKLLSEYSRLGCFTDPDQMIHRFRGATDDRIHCLMKEKTVKVYPLQSKCLRTDDHDLLDFAEAILDNNPPSKETREAWKRRFLKDYFRTRSRGTLLKITLGEFYKDYYTKRRLHGIPTIAMASYSNNAVSLIRYELLRQTGKIKRAYSSKVLEPDHDESIEDLLIHIAIWLSNNSEYDLRLAVKIIGTILAPKDMTTASEPIKCLLSPEKLLSGDLVPHHTAKIVISTIKQCKCDSSACTDILRTAAGIVEKLAQKISKFDDRLTIDRFEERRNRILSIGSCCSGRGAYEELCQLKRKLTNERLQRCVLQRVVPIRGRVAATMHKLKGKEFDYVMLLMMPGESLFTPPEESELDGRRLLYVGLTRARYDARILYIGSVPPPLLTPYL